MVVIASLALPVFATPSNGLNPKDFISDTVIGENDSITVFYSFADIIPALRFSDNAGGATHLNAALPYSHKVTEGASIAYVFTYPFGVRYSAGNKLTQGGFLDVSDILPGADFQMSSEWEFDVDCQSFVINSSDIKTQVYVMTFDSEGNYIDTQSASSNWEDVTSDGYVDPYIIRYHYITDFTFSVPDGVTYIVPYLTSTFIFNTAVINPTTITVQENFFSASVNTNMIYQNSLLMQAVREKVETISGQIDNALDKLDDIFHGSDEQNQQANDSLSQGESLGQDLDDLMAELDQYDDVNVTSSGNVIAEFLSSKAYLHVQHILRPLLDWDALGLILITILAISNLSLILFGR